MESLHILQVTPRYPPQSGGVETHVQKISERLVDHGYKLTVVTADAGNQGCRRELRNGVQVRRYRSAAPDGAIHLCPQIAAVVRRSDADIIHAHNYHSFPLFFAIVGAGDRPVVATTHYHGASANSLRDQLLSLYQPVGRWVLHRADCVIAVSDWEREQLMADFGIDAAVIPNGIEIERFENAEPYQRERPYLLTVGRLVEYKGIQYAIRAMKELPSYDLLVAGSGPYKYELNQVARGAGVTDQVEFLGYVDEEKLPGLYAGATVYVTLSEFEAYGMTVAEALAAGTPCVVRESGGLKDWTAIDGVVSVSGIARSSIQESIELASGTRTANLRGRSWPAVVTKLCEMYADHCGRHSV